MNNENVSKVEGLLFFRKALVPDINTVDIVRRVNLL